MSLNIINDISENLGESWLHVINMLLISDRYELFKPAWKKMLFNMHLELYVAIKTLVIGTYLEAVFCSDRKYNNRWR